MRIDINTLKNGILKNLRNSQELIDDSEILFKNEKFARSYLLSHIAIEESSKCAMLLKVVAFNIWNEEIDIKNVRKRYSNHKEKIKNFELLNLVIGKHSIDESNFNKVIDDSNNCKNNSLYVSWTNENIFTLPSEIFTKEKAEEKLNLAIEYIKLFTSISIKLIQNENEIYEELNKSKSLEFVTKIINIEKERNRK
jgi:AbiV family abortive infection protein